MEILRKNAVPTNHINGSDEIRRYYESSTGTFRIVVTHIPPGHVQNEHRHEHLLDIIYVVDGKVDVSERRDGTLTEITLDAGDMACFTPPFFHNLANRGSIPATTLTLKITGNSEVSPESMKEIFEGDWIGHGGS